MNDHLLPPHRRPVVIADSKLRAGSASTRVTGDGPEALLRQYLRLIRRVRNQQRDRSVALRRADIATLADHLGWTDDEVLARLADLMGATRRQRAAMLAILATGASLITIAGPLDATVAASAEAGVGRASDDPVVVLSDHLATGDRPSAEHAARLVLSDEPVARPTNVSNDRTARHAPVLDAQRRRDESAVAARIDRGMPPAPSPTDHPDSAVSPSDPEPRAVVQSEANADGHDDPPTVAVGEPPVPPATDVDGNSVAVGEPPVPPATDPPTVAVGEPPVPPATDADGNSVAVGEPPVPPATIPPTVAVGEPPVPPATDADGNSVAVGEPPVPPVPPATDDA